MGLTLLGFIIIASVYLVAEHSAHLWGLLVWLPLLACPLMHFFMHGGHGGDPDGGIATLSRMLLDQDFTLPPRPKS